MFRPEQFAFCIANNLRDFLAIFTVLDVSKKYKVCKIHRTTWDVPITASRKRLDQGFVTQIPSGLQLVHAEGPQSTKIKWTTFTRIIEKTFELRGEA
jgi:hypothetical protein